MALTVPGVTVTGDPPAVMLIVGVGTDAVTCTAAYAVDCPDSAGMLVVALTTPGVAVAEVVAETVGEPTVVVAETTPGVMSGPGSEAAAFGTLATAKIAG